MAGVAFPLTDLQESYVVGATRAVELGGVRPTYYVELDVVGLDVARAVRAFERLVAARDHLRTVVLPEGGQRVLDVDELAGRPTVVDLTGRSAVEREAALRRTRERLSEQGLDPLSRPLWEVVISRLRPHRCRVHLALSLVLLDGRGIRRVRTDWLALYSEPERVLAREPVSFRDCRQALETSEGYAAAWKYWDSRLDTLPEAPRLPLARGVATIDPVRFTRRSLHLDAAEWHRFTTAARRRRLMPVTALLHVFAETLAAWAATPRFCVSVLHQAWTRPEWTEVVGQFGSTVPVEVGTDGGFWDRARATQGRLWTDLEHAAVSGVRIAREAAVRRGRTPYASLPYVFTSMLGQPWTPTGRPVCTVAHSSLRTPHVLIDNQVVEAPDGGVDCVWDTVDDAYPVGLPELLFAAYGRLVSAVACDEESPDPVPPAHATRVRELNTTPGVPPVGRLDDAFSRVDPGRLAVVTPHRTVTYGELALAAGGLTTWLREHEVGPGSIVAVVLDKGWEQVAAVLGILGAGAAYCPVDAGLPEARIQTLLADSGARVVVTRSLFDNVPPPSTVESHDGGPAYLIYTSGSTGRPKGVLVEHAAALNTVLDINERIGLGPDDRVFGVSSLSFDLSVWDLAGTWAAGATLVLPVPDRRPDPVAWAELAVRHGVTVWNSVPALAELLLEAVVRRPELGVPPIRVFLLSGDWIPVSLPARLRSVWPGARILALGGATEASIWSNGIEVERVDPGWRSIPYGVPLRHQTMRVLDERLAVRPPWAEGEIFLGGAGLARGYWADPARTAERFVTHPSTGERLYRTGDLGRYLPDGTVELLGRIDRQVKIDGHRIEPGEVEACLLDHPRVRASVVAAHSGRLVAVVAAQRGVDVHSGELLDHVRDRLPHYLVPSRLHVVAELPLTANGKVDREAAMALLPAHRGAPARTDGSVEARLAALWAEVIGQPGGVGVDEDFFALGGTSLLALRLVNRVRAEWGVDVPLGQVFETPTVRGLAGRLRDGLAGGRVAVELGGGVGTRLYLFHPVGGSVADYVPLARAWAGPVRAYQSRGLVTSSVDERDVVAMAAGFRDELLAEPGPYVLGGWSMGGVLAYEVGRQLAALGRECRVFLLDSDVPAAGEPVGQADFLRDLSRGRLTFAPMSTVDRAVAVAHGLLPPDTDATTYERLYTVYAHNAAALATYRPGPSSVPALLFLAGTDTRRADAWRDLCTRLDVETVAGDHYSIVDSVDIVVGRLREWLDD